MTGMTSHRRFHMNRSTDVTGTPGTGTIAEGIEYTSGRYAITQVHEGRD